MEGDGGTTRELFFKNLDALYKAAGSPSAADIASWTNVNHRQTVPPRTIGGWFAAGDASRALPRSEEHFGYVVEYLLDRAGKTANITAAVAAWKKLLSDARVVTRNVPVERRTTTRHPPSRQAVGRRWRLSISAILAVLLLILGVSVSCKARVLFASDDGADSVNGADIEVLDVTEVDDLLGDWLLPADVDPTPYLSRPTPHTPRVSWMREHGAIAAFKTHWEITLVANRPSAVEIVNIVPELVEPCGPALASGYGYMQERAQGTTPKLLFGLNISDPRPVLSQGGNDQAGKRIHIDDFFASNRLTLPSGEKNTISIIANIDAGYCRWNYRVEYIADAGRKTLTISAPGEKPFELAYASAVSSDYEWAVPTPGLRCDDVPITAMRPKLSEEEFLKLVKPPGGCWRPR